MLNAYIISTEQTRKPHSLLYYENAVLQLQISQYCQSSLYGEMVALY